MRPLWERHGVSSIIVVGGAGDYFDVADSVVRMRRYNPRSLLPPPSACYSPLTCSTPVACYHPFSLLQPH